MWGFILDLGKKWWFCWAFEIAFWWNVLFLVMYAMCSMKWKPWCCQNLVHFICFILFNCLHTMNSCSKSSSQRLMGVHRIDKEKHDIYFNTIFTIIKLVVFFCGGCWDVPNSSCCVILGKHNLRPVRIVYAVCVAVHGMKRVIFHEVFSRKRVALMMVKNKNNVWSHEFALQK